MPPLLALALNIPVPPVAIGGVSLNPERLALIFEALSSALAAAVVITARSPTIASNLANVVFTLHPPRSRRKSRFHDAPPLRSCQPPITAGKRRCVISGRLDR